MSGSTSPIRCSARRLIWVANRPDHLDALAARVVEEPVFVAFARIVDAAVPAAHNDDDIGGSDSLGGQDLGLFRSDVDAFFGHGLADDRIDLVGRIGPGGSDLDAITSEVVEVSGQPFGTDRRCGCRRKGRTACRPLAAP
jgi:hypothetical protein